MKLFKANNTDEYRATADIINGIVKRVNNGQCAEYCKAEFLKTYPACLYLVGRDAERIVIYALETITNNNNGFIIDYTDFDRVTMEETHKKIRLTFQ